MIGENGWTTTARARRAMRALGVALALGAGAGAPAGAQNLLPNPGFESGTSPWFAFGAAHLTLTTAAAHEGSQAAEITDRDETWQGVACDLRGLVASGDYLAVSGWARHDAPGDDELRLTLRQIDDAGTRYHVLSAARVPGLAWTRLAGEITLHVRGTLKELVLYFEGPGPGVTLQADDAMLERLGDWRTAASARIEALRKRDARIRVRDCCGAPVAGATVEVRQLRHEFAFGAALNGFALRDPVYADFFRRHYQWAVLENESKWWLNEPEPGRIDYAKADALLDFCAANDIQARGHSIFWDVPSWVQPWLRALGNPALRQALDSRLVSAVPRFAGRFRHWDVNNEILHGGYYGDRLGSAIYPWMFQRAHELDPTALLMVNDHHVLEGNDTARYIQHIEDLRAQGAPVHGIGAQGHFAGVDPLDLLERFDQLATTGLHIWVTEYDSVQEDERRRADDLEAMYRAAFSHPAVDGVFQWGFWAGSMWRGADAAIVNLDWSLNEAGRRYQALLAEWTTAFDAQTDAAGELGFRGFHGRYEVRVQPATGSPIVTTFELPPGTDELALDVPFGCQVDPRVWLLRNDEIESIAPLTPSLASIFATCKGGALDVTGPDGFAAAGEGQRLAHPGSEDDDDAYLLGFPPAGVEPEVGIVADAGRPLVFYQITYPGVVRLVKSPAGLRLFY